MADPVYQLFDTVRSAVQMAYAALGVSRLNASKIAELDKRLRDIELSLESMVQEYEEEKRRSHGKAISAGIWQSRAKRLQGDLDRLSLKMPAS